MTDIKGELELWYETPKGRFTRKVRSVGEAALLAQVLTDYDRHTEQQHRPDGPPYGLKVYLKSDKKADDGVMGWQDWRDNKGKSLYTLIKEEGSIDTDYLVEYGIPPEQIAGSVRLSKFSGVIMMILDPDRTLGGSEVINVFRGSIRVPDRQIFGLNGWRLDMMSNWEIEWFTAMDLALSLQK